MSLALDLGAHAFRSLRGDGAELRCRQTRAVTAMVADGVLARSWLERMGVTPIACEGHLAIPGDAAAELAQIFPLACQDLVADGRIPYGDPVTRQLIALQMERLLPPAPVENAVCGFVQPGHRQSIGGPDGDLDRRREFVSRVIRLRGYDPFPVNPAEALVLAEMEREQFTGVGVCFGASGCDMVLARRGFAAVSLRLPRGGRWVDEQLARQAGRHCLDAFGNQVLDVEWARRRKEAASLDNPVGDDERLIAELYDELIGEIIQGLDNLLSLDPLPALDDPPPAIVLGGGGAQVAGFEERFRARLARQSPQSAQSVVRLAAGGELSVVRGCLIQALLETRGRCAAERLSA